MGLKYLPWKMGDGMMCCYIAAEFTEDRYKQSAKLLEEIQRLERDKHELEFQASRPRGTTPKLAAAPAAQQDIPLKMCLRKRSVNMLLLAGGGFA